MSKYSILFEAERFHKIGPFRFPVFEDLTPGEAKGIEALTKKQAKSTYRSMRLAQRIAKDRNIPIKDALNALTEIGDDKNEDILYEYSSDIEALSADSISATEQKIDYVSLFMRHRGTVKLPSSTSWTQTEDWTEADTEVLPTKLLNQIFEFILWERDGWPKEELEAEAAGNAEAETPSPKPKS
jgi:hypothetical protein